MGGAAGSDILTGTEDCLYLDIKVPKQSSPQLLPVMFWIHGGGNTSGLKDIYNFSTMVNRHDVIVVTINYRLGAFGWFTHPAIQDQHEGIDKTSNFATLDIIEALKWVKNNIEFFGGDPNNITIFGESAGGHNVLSLIVAPQAKGLFQKAISQSGYTTSISKKHAYITHIDNPIFNHTSNEVVKRLIPNLEKISSRELNKELYSLTTKEFFSDYSDKSNLEVPLLTNDGIVIPKVGLEKALKDSKYIKNVPFMAGSNRDEVKLWIAAAEYFVELDFSAIGSILGIPRVKLKNEASFEAFNYYRSEAWKIRGVIEPISSLNIAGNLNTYAYRYDWDDHRRFIIGDFRELIGAAHATEIPLIAGNNKLVGDYGFLIYPRGPSKRFTSKNMMQFWTNFAKSGKPGYSTNNKEWLKYDTSLINYSNYMILDSRKYLKMSSDTHSFTSLLKDLYKEDDLLDLEKCVVVLQILTFVGDDLYDEYINEYPGVCDRKESEKFLKDNASFIDY